MDDIFQFNQVAVVSDLHLGGDSDFQIFNEGERFAKFVDRFIAQSTGPQALVINGDMVDFLAEPDSTYFDTAGAVARLSRISTDDSFRPVFDAGVTNSVAGGMGQRGNRRYHPPGYQHLFP